MWNPLQQRNDEIMPTIISDQLIITIQFSVLHNNIITNGRKLDVFSFHNI